MQQDVGVMTRQQLEEMVKKLKRKNDELQQENTELKKEPSTTIKNRHSQEFWDDVEAKCLSDPEYVKSLIRNKKITMNDVDDRGQTLLMKAAYVGSYDIVQLCLNLGAKIHQKDYDKPRGWKRGNAINYAGAGGFDHIEQLLTLNAENANISDRISATADIMNHQNGVIENIISEIKGYDATTQEFFEDTLRDIMVKILNKKKIFSDDLLYLVWRLESNDKKNEKNPLNSNLWKCIERNCKEIIGSGNKKEWQWLKQYMIPSSIWFRKFDAVRDEYKDDEKKYLYYKLLELVNGTAKEQLNDLEKGINTLAKQSESLWNELVNWSFSSRYDVVRQDRVPNGVKPLFSHQDLTDKGASSATFNPHVFYDHHQYLPELLLTANLVDAEFHRSIQQMLNIDKDTHIGTLALNTEDDDAKYGGRIEYQRGPVKVMERARSKAENDYINEEFPSSACVLDFNRCSLVFDDIKTLISALDLFRNKVKHYESGNIIDIIRHKNGFKDFIKETQYADIKLNVLIKGDKNSIIGEVQFLLKPMIEFKKKAHNLYAIQRQQEYVETAVSKILPTLLDQNKQLFVAAQMGSVKNIANIMNYANKTETDILRPNKYGDTILHSVCMLGHIKALSFIKSLLNRNQFIEQLYKTNKADIKPIEYCVLNGHLKLSQYIFSIPEVKKQYSQSDDELYRLIWMLFVFCKKEQVIDSVIAALNIRERITNFINYKYPKPEKATRSKGSAYHQCTIIGQSVLWNKVESLKKLMSIIGEKVFVNGALQSDDFNMNAIEYGIQNNKVQNVKYVLNLKEIQQRYATDDGLLFRLLYWTLAVCTNDNMIDIVMGALNITNKRIISLLDYKYPNESNQFGKPRKYHLFNLISQTIYEKDLKRLKKVVEVIGVKAFIDGVFACDGYNTNGLECAIEFNELEKMKYMMQMNGIKERLMNEKQTLWRCVWWMNDEGTAPMVRYLMSELALNEETLKKLQSMKCSETGYSKRTISAKGIEGLLKMMTKKK